MTSPRPVTEVGSLFQRPLVRVSLLISNAERRIKLTTELLSVLHPAEVQGQIVTPYLLYAFGIGGVED
jgi:hypothetical protein